MRYEVAVEDSPQRVARMAGGLWLMCILTSVFGFALSLGIVVRGDASATAANLLAEETRFRLSAIANLLSGWTYLGVTALLYTLLKPVNRSFSFAAACFGMVGVAIGATTALANFLPFLWLRGAQYSAFTNEQLQAGALFAVRLMQPVISVGMVFFGAQMALVGYMIARSSFLPRALGNLLTVGGTIYIVGSLVDLVSPALGASLRPLVMLTALVAEGLITFWLLLRGVDELQWRAQAQTTALAAQSS